MSVKFCIVSGAVRMPSTCRMNAQTKLADTPVRLGAIGMGPQYKTFPTKYLWELIKVFEKKTDDTPNIWKCRIVVALASVESVFCISFIPTDPFLPQTLLVMRMKDVDATAESYPVFCFDFAAYKLMLPQDRVDQVFDLSKLSIEETLGQFDHSLTPIFKKVLGYLQQEEKLKGMALTLKNQEEGLHTSIWFKG